MRYWDYYYPKSTPKKVKGGIKTRTQRGEIGETWWAKKFLELLDSFGWSNRLYRGRSYARMGQVIEYNIQNGLIKAKVQGTMRKPYSVVIKVKTLNKNQWTKVIKEMATQARYLAKLLAGEMPHDIEKVFEKAKVPLFPVSKKDFDANCSCPDWANPCKHIAAVYYIVAEAFDRDPFLIFHLRGRNRKELQKALHKEVGVVEKEEVKLKEEESVEPLSCEPEIFYKQRQKLDHQFSLKLPTLNGAILHRLGVPQFWQGTEKEFYTKMEKIYKEISEAALKIAYEK